MGILRAVRELMTPAASPRVQILSDLHLEVGQQYSSYTFPATAPFLLLGGDIGRLIDYEIGEVTAAATYYLAEIHIGFSRSLMSSERPPGMSDAAYEYWTGALRRLAADPRWTEARAGQGLFEFASIGAEFEALAKRRTAEYRALAKEAGLVQQPPAQ